MERLDKILAGSGRFTRSQARALIASGRVLVNGVPVRKADAKVERTAEIAADGQPVDAAEHVVLMMNKPAEYICSTEDELYPAVTRLLDKPLQNRGVFPIGRLDADVTGLLLLTDDGQLAHRLTAPRSEIKKCYEIFCDGLLTEVHVKLLGSGVTLRDGTAYRPAVLKIDKADASHAFVTVTEGKYHEVKNMIRCCECTITAMRRISIGGLSLDNSLLPGKYRRITENEISRCFT